MQWSAIQTQAREWRSTPRIQDITRARIHQRKARPLTGMIGVPLALVAALCSEQWWALLPLGFCAWWWSPHEWGWEWVDAVGRGLIGWEWALLGSSALVTFQQNRIAVGYIWAGSAALLLLVANNFYLVRMSRMKAQQTVPQRQINKRPATS